MFIKDSSLTPVVLEVMRHKATERPHGGLYNQFHQQGTYLCRACGEPLFRSQDKFQSSCGWPSFDAAISEKVASLPDPDGLRTEIVCAHCLGHLGHVFTGEGYTARNRRYCVNSLSLDFVKQAILAETAEIIVAGGCFWGVQYYFDKLPGVLKTEVGYIGGTKAEPSYEEVCRGSTGHLEALRVVYSPAKISCSKLLQYFFEIHDPTQAGGQGPDRGEQYQSAVFYYTEAQKQDAESLLQLLQDKGYSVATQCLPVSVFWRAEESHQGYYAKTGHTPYCHTYTKRF